jgi:hypothetical protein
VRGAQREITGYLIGQGYKPDGRWEDGGVEGETVRKFKLDAMLHELQRKVQFVGGPLDGRIGIMREDKHPFKLSLNTDTDGYYAMEYQVPGRTRSSVGAELTSEDVIARWHQRSSAQDFMTDDVVIVKDSGARGTAVAPTTVVNEDGTTEEPWLVSVDSNLISVAPDQIRIATPEELSEDDEAD